MAKQGRSKTGEGNPTTSMYSRYTDDEREFQQALDAYKARTGHQFPTCGEILGILNSLGYRKQTVAADDADSADRSSVASVPSAAKRKDRHA
jgi:hypothetical protein